VSGKVLSVTVPGPGELEVRDVADPSARHPRAAAGRQLLKPSSATTTGPGTVRLKLRLTKLAREKLRRKGKVRPNAAITYAPTGGTPNTQTAKLKVKMKR
jgi:hypothetical protein